MDALEGITGTPQGGMISPMLSNVFLHYVLDEWFEQEIKPRMKGQCFLVRFADDFIIGFELERDARRVMEVLPKRFARFGLTIHPTKTKLIDFGRPNREQASGKGNGTFDILGFTHYWARSTQGIWVIKRKTKRQKMRAVTRAIWGWCKWNRHQPINKQWKTLCRKLRGHYPYFGIRGTTRLWRCTLSTLKGLGSNGWGAGIGMAKLHGKRLMRTIGSFSRCQNPGSSMMSNLQGSEVIRRSCVNAPITEEPYERIVHVRISGGRRG